MFKNVASKIALFAFDITTGAAKTGDSANITAYVSKDWGTVTVLGDTSATEMDSTNAKGWYLFDLTAGETNADALLYTGKSSTTSISVVGQLIYTLPANFTTQSIDSSGRVDVIKVAGTTQTAGDIVGLIGSPASGTLGGDTTTIYNTENTHYGNLIGGFNALAFKRSTAVTGFPFPMKDSTTHLPKTGLTVTATRSLDGAAYAACANAVSEVSGGNYKITLATTDVDAKTIALRFTATGADQLDLTIVTN